MRPGPPVPLPRCSTGAGSSPRARSARSSVRPGLRPRDGPHDHHLEAHESRGVPRRIPARLTALAAGAVIASYLVRVDVWPGAGYALMATLLGVSAGTADVTAGVFGGLVTTGRSPVALFLARIPAGLALSVGFTLAGYVVGDAGPALLAGHPAAGPGGPIESACAAFLLGLGLSSLGAMIWGTVSRDA